MSIWSGFNSIATTVANVVESGANTYAAITAARNSGKNSDAIKGAIDAAKAEAGAVIGNQIPLDQANAIVDRIENAVATFKGNPQPAVIVSNPAPSAAAAGLGGNTMIFAVMAFGMYLLFKRKGK